MLRKFFLVAALYCAAVLYWTEGTLTANLLILGLNIAAACHSTVLYGKLLEGLSGARSFVDSAEKMHDFMQELRADLAHKLNLAKELSNETGRLAVDIDAKLQLHRIYANESEERIRDLITKVNAKGN